MRLTLPEQLSQFTNVLQQFDEVNEATAMFKVAAGRRDAPDQGYWLTLDADGFTLPSDWYLRLAGEIAKGFRAGKSLAAGLPGNPGPWSNLAITVVGEALAGDSIGVATGVAEGIESLAVIDSLGVSRAATVLAVGPGRVTFLVPGRMAVGGAVLVGIGADGTVRYGNVPVGAVAPALFEGVVNGRSVALYGTGVRGRSSLEAVTCTIGGVAVAVIYAGPQGEYPGLDQVNVELPETFGAAGTYAVVVTVDGIRSASISIAIL